MFYPKRNKYVIIGLLLFSLTLAACSQEPVKATRVVEGERPGPKVDSFYWQRALPRFYIS